MPCRERWSNGGWWGRRHVLPDPSAGLRSSPIAVRGLCSAAVPALARCIAPRLLSPFPPRVSSPSPVTHAADRCSVGGTAGVAKNRLSSRAALRHSGLLWVSFAGGSAMPAARMLDDSYEIIRRRRHRLRWRRRDQFCRRRGAACSGERAGCGKPSASSSSHFTPRLALSSSRLVGHLLPTSLSCSLYFPAVIVIALCILAYLNHLVTTPVASPPLPHPPCALRKIAGTSDSGLSSHSRVAERPATATKSEVGLGTGGWSRRQWRQPIKCC